MKKTIGISMFVVATIIILSSCGGRKDCQGHRHRVKTEMGGFL